MVSGRYYGYKIEFVNDVWIYSDTGKSVQSSKNRNCGKCETSRTKLGHDGCLKTLKYVTNACCGHGENREAYVQFFNKICLRGVLATLSIKILKRLSYD